MNLSTLLDYMKFLQAEEGGYFFDIAKTSHCSKEYDIFLKDEIWHIREHVHSELPQLEYERFSDSTKALTKILNLGIDQNRLTELMKQAIIEKALWHFMKFKNIENNIGETLMKKGAESMAAFAEVLTMKVGKMVREKYGKFELIKTE